MQGAIPGFGPLSLPLSTHSIPWDLTDCRKSLYEQNQVRRALRFFFPLVTVAEAGKLEFCNQSCRLTPKGCKWVVEGRCFRLQHPTVPAGGGRWTPSAPQGLGDAPSRAFHLPAGCQLQPGPGRPDTLLRVRKGSTRPPPPPQLVSRCARASGLPAGGGNSRARARAF